MQGSGCVVQDSGIRVQGLGCWVQGPGLSVEGFGGSIVAELYRGKRSTGAPQDEVRPGQGGRSPREGPSEVPGLTKAAAVEPRTKSWMTGSLVQSSTNLFTLAKDSEAMKADVVLRSQG